MSKNNIVDMWSRRQEQLKGAGNKERRKSVRTGSLHDMTKRRQEIINEERRDAKRTILSEFIGASVVVPERGLLKVALVDISENGIAFDLKESDGFFQLGDDIVVRVYLNSDSYFPFEIKVKNMRFIQDESVSRVGGEIFADSINEQTLFHFVKFIENVSVGLKHDSGDMLISNIK